MAILPDYTLNPEAVPFLSGSGAATLDTSQYGFPVDGGSTRIYSQSQVWFPDASRPHLGAKSLKCSGFHNATSIPNATGHLDMNVSHELGTAHTGAGVMVEGDEEWVGFSLLFPTGWPGTASWGVITEWCSGTVTTHPSYGPMVIDGSDASRLKLRIKTGLCPGPGAGTYNPIPPPNGNGYDVFETLLGPGSPVPFTLEVWHDFIVYTKYQARSNGILEFWHRVNNGAWGKLYSNRNDGTALINRAPHPTWYYNLANGTPGEGGTAGAHAFRYRMYRSDNASDRARDCIYWADRYFRRSSFQNVLNVFGGGAPAPTLPDPAANHLRIAKADQGTSLTGIGNDFKRVIRRAVGAGITAAIDQGYAYLAGPSSGGGQTHRIVVYDDDGPSGGPGSLVGMSDPVTVAQSAAASWVSFPFSTPANALGDLVYIGLHEGGPGQGTVGIETITNGGWVTADTYADGPSNPFGNTPAILQFEVSLVVDYTLASDTQPPAFVGANVFADALSMDYDEALDAFSVPSPSAFAVTVNAVPIPVTLVMVSGSSVQLALQSAALAGDIVTVAYTKPGSNPLQDVSGNDSLSLVATTVSNQTVAVGARLVNPALRVAIARRSDPTDRRAGVGGGL